jgi:dTDP-4-dehydrorhamnose 3,5-epimerase
MNIDGVLTLTHVTTQDARGSFMKIYRDDLPPFDRLRFAESFYSRSKRGVVRGLHFQTPPFEHQKLVTCLSGSVFDCVVDLRRRSPTFGAAFSCELVAGEAILIPVGCAHGFCALSDDATLLYHVTSPYAPDHDKGIHWTSAKVVWPVESPILSARDESLPRLSEFESPF